jgi:hypothetical protein
LMAIYLGSTLTIEMKKLYRLPFMQQEGTVDCSLWLFFILNSSLGPSLICSVPFAPYTFAAVWSAFMDPVDIL